MEYLETIAILLNGIEARLTTIEGSIGCVEGEKYFSFKCERLNIHTTGLTCMRLWRNNCASCMGCRKGFDAIRDLTRNKEESKCSDCGEVVKDVIEAIREYDDQDHQRVKQEIKDMIYSHVGGDELVGIMGSIETPYFFEKLRDELIEQDRNAGLPQEGKE